MSLTRRGRFPTPVYTTCGNKGHLATQDELRTNSSNNTEPWKGTRMTIYMSHKIGDLARDSDAVEDKVVSLQSERSRL